jgi:hypothetical protein
MYTCDRFSIEQTASLPTRQQLKMFLQTKGSPKKLEQMSTWEQIQLTHEYQCWAEKQQVRRAGFEGIDKALMNA